MGICIFRVFVLGDLSLVPSTEFQAALFKKKKKRESKSKY